MPATEYTEEEKHLHRVEGGYKATLSNANSSEEAKKHAQEQLDKIARGEKPEEGAYSHTSETSGESTADGKNLGNVIGGFKGTLSNPNTSEEAKQHAREELKKLGVSEDDDEKKGLKRSSESEVTSSPKKQKELTEEEKHLHHIEGGYKATLSNPKSSEEAKKHAQEQLDKIAKGEKVEAAPNSKELTEEEKHMHHIEGGYKATLSNANSSEEAKKHAQEQLDKIAKGEKPEEGAYSRTSETSGETTADGKNLGNVIGGFRGTLSNPNTSEEAKKHAREELKKLGVSEEADTKEEKESSKKTKDSDDKEEKESNGKKKQGFAAMPKEKVQEIASKGGRTAHAGEEPAPLKNQ